MTTSSSAAHNAIFDILRRVDRKVERTLIADSDTSDEVTYEYTTLMEIQDTFLDGLVAVVAATEGSIVVARSTFDYAIDYDIAVKMGDSDMSYEHDTREAVITQLEDLYDPTFAEIKPDGWWFNYDSVEVVFTSPNHNYENWMVQSDAYAVCLSSASAKSRQSGDALSLPKGLGGFSKEVLWQTLTLPLFVLASLIGITAIEVIPATNPQQRMQEDVLMYQFGD